MKQTKGMHLLGKRVRLILDPVGLVDGPPDDLNELKVEGTVLACSHDGPTLIFEDEAPVPLIDILSIEVLDD